MSELLQAFITNNTQIARNIILLELQGVDKPLPAFSAGAHIDIQIPGHPEAWRSYSLTNDPAEKNSYKIAILREKNRPDSATNALCDHAAVGTTLTLHPPHNTFPLDESATDFLFIAGGIGIAPLHSMMLVLRRQHKPFSLFYTAHTSEEAAFWGEISSWSENTRVHFSQQPPQKRMDVHSLIGPYVDGKKLYCCGPEGLMNAVLTAALASAWPSDSIRFERFSVPLVSKSAHLHPCEVVAGSSKKKPFPHEERLSL